MDIFGTQKIRELETKLAIARESNFSLLKKNDLLMKENITYANNERSRASFTLLLEEKIPTEQNARREYFADITMFYTKHFKDKLQHLKSTNLKELAILWKPEAEYQTYRDNINCLNSLEDWFEYCERSHLSDLAEQRQSVENTLGVDTVQGIKNKLNL